MSIRRFGRTVGRVLRRVGNIAGAVLKPVGAIAGALAPMAPMLETAGPYGKMAATALTLAPGIAKVGEGIAGGVSQSGSALVRASGGGG